MTIYFFYFYYYFRKSTVVRLLYRFFDPDDGQILIGQQNIKDFTMESLRRNIGIVPQVREVF